MGDWSYLAVRNPVSAGTHFVAFLWAILGTVVLWRLCRGDRVKQLSVGCFGLSMILLYAASATYHALVLPPEQLHFFRLLDYSAIYLLIAGTYTPIFMYTVRGRLRAVLLAAMWGLAVVGIAWKWTLPTHYSLSVAAYLGMGWLGILAVAELYHATGLSGTTWGLAGGVLYTIGAALDLSGWPVFYPGVFGSHELLHVLTMGGTLCHFLYVALYVVPPRRHAVLRTTAKPSLALRPGRPEGLAHPQYRR